MNVVKIFVSLMILFVVVNFVIAIYRFLKRGGVSHSHVWKRSQASLDLLNKT